VILGIRSWNDVKYTGRGCDEEEDVTKKKKKCDNGSVHWILDSVPNAAMQIK
jgi:hypothetical protein